MTTPIANIAPISQAGGLAAPAAPSNPGEFQQILTSAINNVETLRTQASDAVQKFMSGENEELHTSILATQKAELAFELGLQVRNKVVDAYQEIMKMQM